MVPLATHRLNFSRKTISTKTDLYITHTKDTGRVPVHHNYSLCQAFRLRGRRIEMWAGKLARGVGLGWERSRSLTSRRTRTGYYNCQLRCNGGLRLGFTGLGFGVKIRGGAELPPPPGPTTALHRNSRKHRKVLKQSWTRNIVGKLSVGFHFNKYIYVFFLSLCLQNKSKMWNDNLKTLLPWPMNVIIKLVRYLLESVLNRMPHRYFFRYNITSRSCATLSPSERLHHGITLWAKSLNEINI